MYKTRVIQEPLKKVRMMGKPVGVNGHVFLCIFFQN